MTELNPIDVIKYQARRQQLMYLIEIHNENSNASQEYIQMCKDQLDFINTIFDSYGNND